MDGLLCIIKSPCGFLYGWYKLHTPVKAGLVPKSLSHIEFDSFTKLIMTPFNSVTCNNVIDVLTFLVKVLNLYLAAHEIVNL